MKRHQQAGIKLRNRTKLGMDLCDTDSNQGIIATHRMCVCVSTVGGDYCLQASPVQDAMNDIYCIERDLAKFHTAKWTGHPCKPVCSQCVFV